MQHPIIKYALTTFSYGFYRSIASESIPDELYINKLINSVFIGSMYVNPMLLPWHVYKLAQRIEIKTCNKDSQQYKESYCDFGRYNYNTI